MTKETILITGCAGLFGTHISKHFTGLGYNVVGLDNLSGGYEEYVDPKSTFLKIDITDQNLLKATFQQYQPQYVVHTAAMAAVCLSPFTRMHTYNTNLIGYSNLLNCSITNNIKRFLHFSSMDIYGKAQTPFTEDMIPMPEDPYGISKYAIELDLKSAHDQFGLNYNIIRPHNCVAVNQNIWDRYRNVLGIWTRKCLNHEPITVYGDGMQIRAFSDVKFYLKPIEKLLFDTNIKQQIYNIGADQHITILDAAKLLQKVAKKFGYNSDIVHLEARHEVMEAYPSHDKAKRDLGFVDNTVLEETLCELFFWAMHQPNREVKYVDYEITKGLLPVWKKS